MIKGDNKVESKQTFSNLDKFAFWISILLSILFGVLLTIGGILWLRSGLKNFFNISYAGYAAFWISVLLGSELWAVFVQIPSISGYHNFISPSLNKLRIVIGIILIVVSIGFGFGFFHQRNLRNYLVHAMYNIINKTINYKEKIEIFDEIIEGEGVEASAEHFAERGKLYLEIAQNLAEGDSGKYILPDKTSDECFNQAIINLRDAINKDGYSAEYYYLKGKAELLDNKTPSYEAYVDLEKAIELDKTNPDYYYYCARALYGKPNESMIDTKKADNNKKRALSYINEAIDMRLHAKKEVTEKDHNEPSENSIEEQNYRFTSADSDETLAEYYYYAGEINESFNNKQYIDEAIIDYKKAINCFSAKADYYAKLGISLYNRAGDGDTAEAEYAFSKAIEIDKSASDYSDEAYHLSWKACVIGSDEERFDEAKDCYEHSIACNPDYAYAYNRLAKMYSTHNFNEKAIATYTKGISNCEDNSELYYERGIINYRSGKNNSAINDLKNAIQINDSFAKDGYYYIGCAYHIEKNYSEAYQYYQLALDKGNEKKDEIKNYMKDCKSKM